MENYPKTTNGKVNPDYIPPQSTVKLDRRTALNVLQDISSKMYPDINLFGRKTLVISREDFEKIRAKYLDNKKDG